jgi:tRNA uridine 5-carboxymethylaminomethyl modification enzyme
VDSEIARLNSTYLAPSPELKAFLEARGTTAPASGASLAELLRRPQVDYASLSPFDPERPRLDRAVCAQVEISIKYEGYIKRQMKQAEEFRRMESRRFPADIDYMGIHGIRMEARQKLNKIRPENFGQASRISGVNPADIAALMIYLEKKGMQS